MVRKTKSMPPDINFGPEVELLTISPDGSVANEADIVITDARNDVLPGVSLKGKNRVLVPDFTYAQVEANFPYSNSLEDLERIIAASLSNAVSIAGSHNLFLVPSGSLVPEFLPERRESSRYRTIESLVGHKQLVLWRETAGTHIHIDRFGQEDYQFNVELALDPLFALVAATPYSQGRFAGKDSRVHNIRYEVFKQIPAVGMLPGYARTDADIQASKDSAFRDMLKAADKKNIPLDEQFFREYIRWPVRPRGKTHEIRSYDSTDITSTLAILAVLKGVMDCISNDKPMLEYNGDFTYSGGALHLPAMAKLRYLGDQAMEWGLDSPCVSSYIRNILDFAKQGLGMDERHYLLPFYRSVHAGEVPADRIRKFALSEGIERSGTIDEYGAMDLLLFMAENFYKDMQRYSSSQDHSFQALRPVATSVPIIHYQYFFPDAPAKTEVRIQDFSASVVS